MGPKGCVWDKRSAASQTGSLPKAKPIAPPSQWAEHSHSTLHSWRPSLPCEAPSQLTRCSNRLDSTSCSA